MKIGDFVIALGITLAVLFVSLSLSRREITAESRSAQYNELTLTHSATPIVRGSGIPARLEVRIAGGLLPDSSSLFVYLRPAHSAADTAFKRAPMLTVPGEGLLYRRDLTNQAAGKEFEYFIQLVAAKDSTLADTILASIPTEQQRNDRAVLSVRFEGSPPKTLLTMHIIFMFMALLLMVMALLSALYFSKVSRSFMWAARLSLAALASLIIGVFFLGTRLETATYGSAWSGFPAGTNLTDTIAVLIVLYWLVIVLVMRRQILTAETAEELLPRRVQMLIIVGTALAIVAYLIPHGTGRI